MEPERKIEKLLRAFAKKRQADAGDAIKLHPATRRLLQGEVARRLSKPRAGTLPLWQLLRKRWAVGLGFALVLCLGAALFWPTLRQPTTTTKNVEVMSSAKSLGAAATIAAMDNSSKLPATLGVPTSQAASVPAQMDAISGQSAGQVALGGISAESQNNNQLAYSAEKKNGKTALLADSAAQTPRDELSAPTNGRQPAQAVAENAPGQRTIEARAPVVAPPVVAATVPAAPLPVAGEPTVLSDSATRAATRPSGAVLGAASSARESRAVKMVPAQTAVKFKSELAGNSSQSAAQNSQRFVQAATKKNLPVLESFELQQKGDRISVVDRDGSIYKGSLRPVELAAKDDLSKSRATVDKPGLAALRNNNLGEAGNAKQAEQPSAQNYFFRVSGANRSLKQNVVFAGNLIQLSNATGNAAQNFGGGGGGGGQLPTANANVTQQQLFSNSRITGTVTINKTNQIEINALPVNP